MRTKGTSSRADSFVRWTSTIGYFSHSTVYFLMGGFAVAAGFASADEKDSSGVLRFIMNQPFGKAMLVVLILGFICYVAWRSVQTFMDTEDVGWDRKGLALRASYAASGVTFLALTYLAIGVLTGKSGGGDEKAESWSALTLSLPLGNVLLGAVGLGVLLVGLYQGYRGVLCKFADDLNLEWLSSRLRGTLFVIFAYAYVTRAVLFLLIAVYLFQAAWQGDPDEVEGLGGALNSIHDSPAGRWLIAGVGIGLMAYSAFAFTRARFGDIGMPSENSSDDGGKRRR